MPSPDEAQAAGTNFPEGIIRFVVGLLLLLHAALALSAISRRGFAMDEIDHLTMGYSEWLTHDYRVDTANGDLIKRFASIPLLATKPHFPGGPKDASWRDADYFKLGNEFFFASGNDPDRMLLAARAAAVLLSAALGLVVFVASRRLFGTAGGLLSLFLYSLCPVILAHAAMVTSDMSLAFTLSAATYLVWRLLHRVAWATLALSGAATGLLFLAKLTAVLIIPITGALLVLRLARNAPWRVELGGKAAVWPRRGRQLLLVAGLCAFHVAAAAAIVWANYEFRFAGSSMPDDPGLAWTELPPHPHPIAPLMQSSLDFLLGHRLLPEGYVRGANANLLINQKRLAFMHGHWSYDGWRTFFLYAFAIKTPLFLFAILGLGAWFWALGPGRPGLLYDSSPWWVLVGAVLLAASLQHVDIGHRHILAVYPALYVLAGSAALPNAGRPWRRLLLGIGTLGFAITSFYARPDYLAYVNVLGGGMNNGYRDLTDGSEDWGLGLPQLKGWLDEHNPGDATPVFLSYRGTDSPEYRGIRSRNLYTATDGHSHVLPLVPGYYAVSASVLEGMAQAIGPWNSFYEENYGKVCRMMDDASALPDDRRGEAYARLSYPYVVLRLARICAWLRRPQTKTPEAFVGHAILVWKLTEKDISDALTGPVPADNAGWESFIKSLSD
ncbi:MAG TPA: glycosyltransferase family 39 protein [Opitutaceae bacterium]|nr:glycosyltransferase family 39 protein [Opitutaceae bacterium]